VKFWPPKQNDSRSAENKPLKDLYALMNPPSHLGNIEVTGDDRSFVYATGGKDQPRVIIFVSFDPAINLGLRKWRGERENFQSGGQYEDYGRKQCQDDMCGGKGKDLREKANGEQPTISGIPLLEFGVEYPNNGKRWIWREPAMYRAIDRGYDFSL
jgi:hypothetical protein